MSEVVKAAQAGMVYATVPFQFIILFAMKLSNLIAPGFIIGLMNKKGDDMMPAYIRDNLKTVDDAKFLFSSDRIWQMVKTKLQNIYKDADKGAAAPNPKVVVLDSGEEVDLLSFAKVGRPLVLNFGSCT